MIKSPAPARKVISLPSALYKNFPISVRSIQQSQKTLKRLFLPAYFLLKTNPTRSFPRQTRNTSHIEHFQFEMLRISNHTACRFAEKPRFSAHFGPGGAVPPSRVSPISKVKRSDKARWGRDGGSGGKGNPSRASRGVSLPPRNNKTSLYETIFLAYHVRACGM